MADQVQRAARPFGIVVTGDRLVEKGRIGSFSTHRIGTTEIGLSALADIDRDGNTAEVLPLDVDIEVQPYSLITARNRTLTPAAQTLYDAILERIR